MKRWRRNDEDGGRGWSVGRQEERFEAEVEFDEEGVRGGGRMERRELKGLAEVEEGKVG